MKITPEQRAFLLQNARELEIDKAIFKLNKFILLLNESDILLSIKHWSQDVNMTETFLEHVESMIQMLKHNKP